MARDDNLIPLDVLFEEKTLAFRSGEDKDHDKDLDELIWKLGDYENEEPPDEASQFREDAPIEEELAEKELTRTERGRTYLKERAAGEDEPVEGKGTTVQPLRIEIDGQDCEVVCGWISAAKKKKIDRYCRENDVTVADIWYEESPMKTIMGKNWNGWHKNDGILHETGLVTGEIQSRELNLFVDDEPVGDVDIDLIGMHYETPSPPRAKKGCVAVTAGILNDAKYVFSLDIAGDFDAKRLTFHYRDLSKLGMPRKMLTEIRYGNRALDFCHRDFENEDALDVVFLP